MFANIRLRKPGTLPNRLRTSQIALVLILVLLLVAIATHRIWQLRVAAERAAVLQVIGTLHSAISIQLVARVRQGGLGGLASMEHADPMTFLEPPPLNYRRLDGPVPPEQLLPGYWYFEPELGILIYRVRFGDYLDTGLAGVPRIRLQLQLRYTDRNDNHRYDADSDDFESIGLVALEPFHWRTP